MFDFDLESIAQIGATFLIIAFFLVALYKKRLKVSKKKNDEEQDDLHWL
ncbi:hypothetical protein H9N25_04255 [Pedobacter riviphilus]|uniref:Uncharacterized protein n=1 Tax=Pedobacter riviphilus TaxID=2766984 RepID=A0ABX6TK35_9SPHI|nr:MULTISPECIES: hypothetical protein [Pedobacter]NII81859.1 hypothetical protein [Pedobacter sp. SG908]NMN35862.1 hypothetical protein [Pedobacter sp. SG918]QNR85682.1 hypothetical protein H9N25_04255 [Pedobacter riviphilus]